MRYFFGILLLCVAAPLRAEDIDLVLLAGQSNAQGWMGDAKAYPADSEKRDAKIPLYWKSPGIGDSGRKWTTLQPQSGRFPAGHFGLEVSFARQLQEHGFHPAIFKYTLGSTSLAKNWKLPGEKGMYDDMAKEVKHAADLLTKEGHTVKFAGFIWIQGESDAQTKELAQAYEERLRQVLLDLRDNVTRTASLPLVLGVDEQHPWVKKNPEVVRAQQHLAETLPTCIWTSLEGLEKADSTHLTPRGLVLHGQRVYDDFAKISKPPANAKP